MALSYEKRHLSFIGAPHQRTTAGDNTLGVVRNLLVNTTIIGSVGAALTTLHSLSVPVGSLPTDGSYLIVELSGPYASNANAKRVVINIAGAAYEDSGLIDIEALGWTFKARIIRLLSTSIRIESVFDAAILQTNAAGVNSVTGIGGRMNQRTSDPVVANLNSNALPIVVQGQGTANNDVTQNLSIIEYVQN